MHCCIVLFGAQGRIPLLREHVAYGRAFRSAGLQEAPFSCARQEHIGLNRAPVAGSEERLQAINQILIGINQINKPSVVHTLDPKSQPILFNRHDLLKLKPGEKFLTFGYQIRKFF